MRHQWVVTWLLFPLALTGAMLMPVVREVQERARSEKEDRLRKRNAPSFGGRSISLFEHEAARKTDAASSLAQAASEIPPAGANAGDPAPAAR